MPIPRSAISLGAALLLLCVLAPAQQRRPLLGTVVDADGKPLVGAEVVCAFAPPGAESGAPVDVQRATTDARGRFRANVFGGTRYQVFAMGPADEQGARLATGFVVAAAGPLLALRARHRQMPVTLQLVGLEAWQDLAPFQIRVCLGGTQLDAPLLPVSDGTVSVPPQPRDRCNVDLIGSDKQVLLSRAITFVRAEHKVRVPAPQILPVHVVDGGGKPVAGAVVRERISGGWSSTSNFGPSLPWRVLWRELGRTDEHGRLAARLPLAEPPLQNKGYQQLFLLAEKPGHRSSHSGFTDQLFVDGVEIARDGVEELRFTLRADEPLRGRLQLAGQGVAAMPIAVVVAVRTDSLGGNGWLNEEVVRYTTTAADGSFTLRGLTNVQGATVNLDSSRLHERLVPEELRPSAPYSPVVLHRNKTPIDKTLNVALNGLCPLELQLLDLTGGPAAGIDVLLLSENDDDVACDGWTPAATTDSAGRLSLLLQPGKWLLFARTERGMVHQHLEVQGAEKLSLKVEPMPAMIGRVVDAEGKPVAGASLQGTAASFSSVDGKDESLRCIASNLNWNWIARTTTDADGRFVCCFLDLPGMSFRGRFKQAKLQTPEFTLATGEGEQTFVLQ